MKKSKQFLFTIILFAFLGCADRTPFKEQEPIKNSALVYVYTLKSVSANEDYNYAPYTISIDNKIETPKLMQSEYAIYDLKPKELVISARKNVLIEKDVKLNLEAGNIYYLKIKENLDDESFSFQRIDETNALQEIAKTGLVGSNYIFENDDKVERVSEKTSDTNELKAQTDEIQRLYDMKEKGILTQEEFETLKAKVIN